MHHHQKSHCHNHHCHCPCHKHEESCSSCHHHHEHEHECCDHSEAFLHLADEAWKEVLKEKIKEHILVNDHKIGELAKIIADANHERWKKKMSCHGGQEGYKQKLRNLFKCS